MKQKTHTEQALGTAKRKRDTSDTLVVAGNLKSVLKECQTRKHENTKAILTIVITRKSMTIGGNYFKKGV